jgi:hypothetical protein
VRDVLIHRRLTPWTLAVAAAACTLASAQPAEAQSTIKSPGLHDDYRVELEPHALVGAFTPPGDGTGDGLGAGLRASFVVVPNGFVSSINDEVAVGVGVDAVHYFGSGPIGGGTCARFATGAGGTRVCTEVTGVRGGASSYLFFPVVLQWSFFLTRRWSVFGEPGISLYWFDDRTVGVTPALFLGGRYHFSDRVTLTMRVGYPTVSVGLSLLL